MDAGEKVSGGLIIAGGDSSELLELADEILDEMARLVQLSIKSAARWGVAPGRDAGVFPRREKGFDHALIGLEGFIRQYGIGFHLRQEHVGACKIMRLTTGEEERKRIAQRIDHEMDLCAQSA